VDHSSLEIEVIRLQCQYFSNSHPGHCSDCEHCAKGLPCCGDNLPGLVGSEAARCFLHFLRGHYELSESTGTQIYPQFLAVDNITDKVPVTFAAVAPARDATRPQSAGESLSVWKHATPQFGGNPAGFSSDCNKFSVPCCGRMISKYQIPEAGLGIYGVRHGCM
jgi:hypothetical protein